MECDARKAYAALLRWCGNWKAAAYGKRLHAHLRRRGQGQGEDPFLATLLLRMHGKCGNLALAQELFARMPKKGVSPWTAMIAAYAQNGQPFQSLSLLDEMDREEEEEEEVRPNEVTFISALHACVSSSSVPVPVGSVKLVHGRIVGRGLETLASLQIGLVNAYGKRGSIEIAEQVFETIHQRNTISWTALITVHARNGCSSRAIGFYHRMNSDGVKPDRVTFLSCLEACADSGRIECGKAIHFRIVDCCLELDSLLNAALINMYGKCGSLENSRVVFYRLRPRNAIAWTAIIAACTRNGHCKEALEMFTDMESEGVKPSNFTFLCALDACTSIPDLHTGKAIHRRISHIDDVALKIGLINMYGKCGSLKEAREIFDDSQSLNVVLWTSMITSYAQNGHGKDALWLFDRMIIADIKPDRVTFLSTLDACATLANLDNARTVHNHITQSGIEQDYTIKNALIYMYGKCGSPKEAKAVFDGIPQLNVHLCNSMIVAYIHNGQDEEALKLFKQMDKEGINPDKITYLSVLNACANLTSWEYGMAIKECIFAKGLESDIAVKSALLNMFAKCGNLNEALAMFEGIHEHDVVSWNTMLAMYAQNGHGKKAMRLFHQLASKGGGRVGIEGGVKPDKVTFLCLLNACSHTGLLDEGWQVFNSMRDEYDLTPTQDHYVCVLDLLGRSRLLTEEAKEVVKNMPVQMDTVAWTSLHVKC